MRAGALLLALGAGHGCGDAAPVTPAPPARPTPTSVRPLAVPEGGALTYVVRGPAGILDHPERKRQLPRPDRIVLTQVGAEALACRIELGATPPDQQPLAPIPAHVDAEADAIGMVRVVGDAAIHDHAPRPETLAPRMYALIATVLLLRPSQAAPAGARRWEDVGFLHAGGVPIGARLGVEAQGPATVGGIACERYRWQLESGLPQFWVGEAQVLDAFGLTFYDPVGRRVVAAEAMLRFAADASAWGMVPWTWLSCALEGVEYTGHEEDLTWVDGAFTVEQRPRPPGWKSLVAENTAIKRLSGMARGMRDFRAHVRVDVDRDGRGEAGFLSCLAGVTNLRTPGGLLGPKVPLVANATYTEYGVFEFHGRCDARGQSRGETYRWYCCLAGADGPLAQGERPPDGDPRHADAQEQPGGWALWGWPDTDSEARLVLHVDDEGVIRGTYDLPWRGPEGGLLAPRLDRPTDGVTWTARSPEERLPPDEAEVRILAADVVVPPEAHPHLARQMSLRIRLQMPDAFGSLPKEAGAELRQREWMWLDAWRDRRVSVEELEPILDDAEAIMQGRAPR